MPPRKDAAKPIKALPKKDIVWVHTTLSDGREFYETSSQDRTAYFLYQKVPDGYCLVAKGKTPMAFRSLMEPETPSQQKKRKRS